MPTANGIVMAGFIIGFDGEKDGDFVTHRYPRRDDGHVASPARNWAGWSGKAA